MEEGGRVRVVGGRTDMRNLEYRKREYTKYLRILLLIFYHDLRLTLGGFCGHEFGEVGERRRGGEGGDMRGKASRHRHHITRERAQPFSARARASGDQGWFHGFGEFFGRESCVGGEGLGLISVRNSRVAGFRGEER